MTQEPKTLPASFLASRGYCCGNKCTNCPFTPRHIPGTREQDTQWITFNTTHPELSYEAFTNTTDAS